MESQQRKHQLLVIASVIGLLVVLVVLVLTLSNQHKPTNSKAGLDKSHTSYDANSGETTRTIQGEDNSGVASDFPTFLGTAPLLNRGLTTDQLANMEAAFYRYSTNNTLHIQQVSISVNNIKTSTINPDTDPVQAIDFPVVFDSKTTMYATIHYSGLSSLELFIKDKSGTQTFDSGIINASSSP